MTKTLDDIDTPAVLIDVDKVERNLQRAQDHADKEGFKLRPHIKTHKLPYWAKRQLALGAVGITVQKLGEAEVFADAGITDLFMPYNIVGPLKLKRLKALNARVTLSVTADSPDTVSGYAASFSADQPLTVLVECDTGGGRCGVQTPAQALALARQIIAAPGLRFGGLMTYAAPGGFDGANSWMTGALQLFNEAGIAVPRVTGGNTPEIWAKGGGPLTERRPGTYIYNDRYQVKVGAATLDDCALTVMATVVSRPTATRFVIDAGSKALTSDLLGMEGYGLIAGTDLVVKALSEEHGVVEMPAASDWPRVGTRLRIVPNHCCPVTNLFDEVNFIKGETVVDTLAVAARGKVA